MEKKEIIIADLCFIIPLSLFRKTPSVEFHIIPDLLKTGIDSIDRVFHKPGACSPTVEGSGVDHPWYMHQAQEDNLLVYEGSRYVDLYSAGHPEIENFEVTPHYVKHGSKMLFEGACILGWPTNVFHRVNSPEGSMSTNFARHFEGFDIKTNFNIYDLNEKTGDYDCIRKGYKDQL